MIAKSCASVGAIVSLAVAISTSALAQPVGPSAPQITGAIRDSVLTVLSGNTRSAANAKNDRGAVADSMVLDHMQLLLSRPAPQEAALEDLIDAIHDRHSPQYHKWLTADELGQRFGVAQSDVGKITAWLGSHGFAVTGVNKSRTIIDFSGHASDVRDAFHTEIHNLDVKGVHHIANMSDPKIPAAMAPVVAGVVSLNDFMPHPNNKPRGNYTFGTNQCFPLSGSSGGPCYAVVPADLATIYNFNPAFSAGITGAGQTIVVIEDTNLYNAANWTTFRSTFGLSGYTTGSLTQVHPSGSLTCTSPGVNSAESEATLDTQWASAAAPGAAIEMASCKDTSTTFGGLIALENILDGSTLPTVVSISYGECEAENGATANAAYNSTYEQAVSEGVSVFVSSGDEGAASCDADEANATHGIGVSGFASSPYDVAVGGTDFGDAYAKTQTTYWNSSDTNVYGSAKSYIPEIPWNDSCGSVLIATYYGTPTPYGPKGYCNAGTDRSDFITTASGSGGPSGCATGKASTTGVVSGTCAGWAKPSWQAGFAGIVNDKVRDIPDVSLFAANGAWGHYYVFCDSDGGGCTGAPSAWDGAGGTSFASPIMAGVMALIAQKTGEKQGNPNPDLYALAASEYGSGGNSGCVSTLGNGVSSSCVFYDVQQGDMDINCTGTHSCYLPSGRYGVLSTTDSQYLPAYKTGTGWDFATGIGTVNVANLVNAWP
jgi:subtilase family serine protease